MTFFTAKELKQLLQNGRPENTGKDHKPVVRLHLPVMHCVFLLTEISCEDPSLVYGLHDLCIGQPELGYVSLNELKTLQTGDGYKVERDDNFENTYPLSVYTSAARRFNAITTEAYVLEEQGSFFCLQDLQPKE